MASQRELSATTLDALLSEARVELDRDKRTNFRIICLSTDLPWERLLQIMEGYFSVSQQGDLYELYASHKKHNKRFHVYLYLYQHPETGAPVLFTLNSYDDFRRTSGSMISRTEGLYTLWIHPTEMTDLKEEILTEEGIRLTGFDYDTFGRAQQYEAERRPGPQRSGSHDSEDAEDVLEEWKLEYGFTPTQLRFDLPTKGTFHFDDDGGFVLSRGDTHYIFSEVVESALEKTDPRNELVQASELSTFDNNGIDRINEIPIEITITDTLSYEDADELVDGMKEYEFYPYSYQAAPGSLLLNGRVVDERNGGMVSVATDGETMTLLPRYESGFDSLLRFYRFIVEEIDPKTSIKLLPGNG